MTAIVVYKYSAHCSSLDFGSECLQGRKIACPFLPPTPRRKKTTKSFCKVLASKFAESFEEHVNELCRTAFYHIRNISRIRSCLIIDSTKTLVHALVTSPLDHCNSLLYGLPDYLIQRLQYVMNAAAKVITCKRKFDHVTPLLIELHWLPVRQRIVFKILLYTFKALHGATPTYLTELISPYVPRRALWSADQPLLEQPTHKLKLIGLRAFSVCAPYLWNSLPFEIKSSASVSIFKAKLKTYLFRQAYF